MQINMFLDDEDTEWFRLFKLKRNINQIDAMKEIFKLARKEEKSNGQRRN